MKITSYNIELRDIHLYAFHGVLKQEREVGAWFTIDIDMLISDHSCAHSDDIAGTVSYADIYDIIKEEMRTPSQLLEHVATRISESIFKQHAIVERIKIRVTKDTPPMGGDRLQASVTIEAER